MKHLPRLAKQASMIGHLRQPNLFERGLACNQALVLQFNRASKL